MGNLHKTGIATDGIGVKIWIHSDNTREVSLTTAKDAVVGTPTEKDDPIRIAQEMTKRLQLEIDVRKPRKELDMLDSDRMVDPATEHTFWDGDDIVERSVIIVVTYDGEKYVPSSRVTKES